MPSRPAARHSTAPPTLRERQHEQTRNVILDALVDQLAETGAFDYSAFELARRAGVSVRTIYRHFPDRDALLSAMSTRINHRLGLYDLPTKIHEQLPELARALFRKFDEYPQLIMASLTTAAGGQIRTLGRRERITALRKGMDELAPDLDEPTRIARTGVITALVSASTWARMRDELGMDGAASGDAIAWAVEVITTAIIAENRAAKKPAKKKEGR